MQRYRTAAAADMFGLVIYDLPGELSPLEVSVLAKDDDTVVLRDWEPESRAERNLVLLRLHRSRCLLLNGAGLVYTLPWPRPWESDGAVPGSALTDLVAASTL